jgi:hypothetical protein
VWWPCAASWGVGAPEAPPCGPRARVGARQVARPVRRRTSVGRGVDCHIGSLLLVTVTGGPRAHTRCRLRTRTTLSAEFGPRTFDERTKNEQTV